MKLIGLINKIYNGELPDKTKVVFKKHSTECIYHKNFNEFEFVHKGDWNSKFNAINLSELNDEVEITKTKNNIGDIYKFCGLDWIIIDKFDNKLKLMSKDVLSRMTYSDNNSNDWVESNVRKFLNEDFINKLDKSKLIKMRTNYDEDKFSEDYIRIPTLREMEKLPINLRDCDNVYWTMTSSYGVSEDCSNAGVFSVWSSGSLGAWSVNGTLGVRPVILVEEN